VTKILFAGAPQAGQKRFGAQDQQPHG
jgi:hypothetical protein